MATSVRSELLIPGLVTNNCKLTMLVSGAKPAPSPNCHRLGLKFIHQCSRTATPIAMTFPKHSGSLLYSGSHLVHVQNQFGDVGRHVRNVDAFWLGRDQHKIWTPDRHLHQIRSNLNLLCSQFGMLCSKHQTS